MTVKNFTPYIFLIHPKNPPVALAQTAQGPICGILASIQRLDLLEVLSRMLPLFNPVREKHF